MWWWGGGCSPPPISSLFSSFPHLFSPFLSILSGTVASQYVVRLVVNATVGMACGTGLPTSWHLEKRSTHLDLRGVAPLVECLWGVRKVLVSVSSTTQSESGGAFLKRKIETRVSGFQGHLCLCLYGEFKASLDYLRSLCGGGGGRGATSL